MKRALQHRSALAIGAAVYLAGAGCTAGVREAPDRVSVLVVSLSSVRADHLEPYGANLASTPTLRALADQGVLFQRAYAASPLGLPSLGTLLTGLNPPGHGLRDEQGAVLGPGVLTLAEQFLERGYLTAAFTATPSAEARWGLDQGFGLYVDRVAAGAHPGEARPAAEVVDDAIRSLYTLDGPVFAFVELADADLNDPERPAGTGGGRSEYDERIAAVDAELRRLVAWWDRAFPDSVLVVTADHGLALGEGGEHGSGALLTDATLRVPLLLRGVGAASGRVPVGERVTDPVGVVDVAPTVLSLADLRVPRRLEGNDLLDEGSDEIYSEATLGWSRLGLAALSSFTDAEGRYVEGAWSAWYPAAGGRVSVQADLQHPTEELAERLAELREELQAAPVVEAPVDLQEPGALGGDLLAPPGNLDPRDAIELIVMVDEVRDRMERGQLWLAERRLRELEERTTDAWGVTALRAQLTLKQGRLGEAVAMLAELYGRRPSEGLALCLGGVLSDAGRWDEAARWFDEVLAANPAQPDALAGRVHVALAMGDADTAEVLLAGAADGPELAWARAELLLVHGRAEEALLEAERALAARPGSAEALATLAAARWELGEPDAAVDLLQEAVSADPYDLALRARLATYLLELGRPRRAARMVAPAETLSPEGGAVDVLYEEAREAAIWSRGRPPG